MRKVLSKLRKAVDDYEMINEGDKIAVGVSGGKDSIALLASLARLREFYPKKFEIIAVCLDMGFDNTSDSYSALQAYCDSINTELVVKYTQIGEIIFNIRQEKNPCSLCARMKRGALHDTAIEHGCNKVAFGHHFDDAVQTFFMNLIYEGRIGCFSPVTYLSRKNIYLIRPLVYTPEKDIESMVNRLKLPVIESRCPANKNTEREAIKHLIYNLEKDYKNLRMKVFGAMQRAHLDNF